MRYQALPTDDVRTRSDNEEARSLPGPRHRLWRRGCCHDKPRNLDNESHHDSRANNDDFRYHHDHSEHHHYRAYYDYDVS